MTTCLENCQCRGLTVRPRHLTRVIKTSAILMVIYYMLSSILLLTEHDEMKYSALTKKYVANIDESNQKPAIKGDVDRTKETKLMLDTRRSYLIKTCSKASLPSDAVKFITGNQPLNMSYCVIPKAGCTMWLRIFKFLAGQKRETGNPLNISKYEIHYEEMNKYKNFHFYKNQSFIASSLRVMTVRHPFTRLWSAYIDKLLLPDFWWSKGRMVVKRTRLGATNETLRCGKDVTFPEFVTYVVQNGHDLKYVGQDGHWLPATDICNPCMFKPDFVAKQETFLDDMTYILRKVNKGDLVDKMKSTHHTEYEIEEEIKYCFKIYNGHKGCTTKVGLSRRIWKAFKLNGYIPPSEEFPKQFDSEDSVDEKSFLSVIRNVRQKYNVSRDDTKRYRKQALEQAYFSIPRENIEALQKLYENDFRMFGYDREPAYIAQRLH